MSKCNKTDCQHFDKADVLCIGCKYMVIKGFKYEPKLDPLKNLFLDAPVMVRIYDAPWQAAYYAGSGKCFDGGTTRYTHGKSILARTTKSKWEQMRLPTITESPRNVWLAAPADGNCPEGAEDSVVIVWTEGWYYPRVKKAAGKDWDWEVVEKFMLIDKDAF